MLRSEVSVGWKYCKNERLLMKEHPSPQAAFQSLRRTTKLIMNPSKFIMPCEVLSNVDNLTIRSWLTCSLRLRISASIYMRAEIVAAFKKNIAFSCLKCYNRYIPKTEEGRCPCQDRHNKSRKAERSIDHERNEIRRYSNRKKSDGLL